MAANTGPDEAAGVDGAAGRPRGGWFRRARMGFRGWRRTRPFWGGLIALLGGIEILLSERAPVAVVVHLGAQGLAGYVVPVVLVLCALLLWFNPAQRIFYSILAVLAALASFITSNLGGFVLGMLLGIVGGSLAFAWVPTGHRRAWHSWSATANGRPLRHMAGTRRGDLLMPRSPGPAVTRSLSPAMTCSLSRAVAWSLGVALTRDPGVAMIRSPGPVRGHRPLAAVAWTRGRADRPGTCAPGGVEGRVAAGRCWPPSRRPSSWPRFRRPSFWPWSPRSPSFFRRPGR
jgi:hypothetical protein